MVVEMEILRSESYAQGRLTYEIVKTFEMGVPVFGIRIASYLFGKREEHLVTNITLEEKTIETLFELCTANTVLPLALREVVEDFIISDVA
ncbi:MAG: DUF6514 family protein [Ruminococcus sp.]|jgi:hypothetical protein|nr:DUF6514 family protein [Ruminococcus sp.]